MAADDIKRRGGKMRGPCLILADEGDGKLVGVREGTYRPRVMGGGERKRHDGNTNKK